ncbi:LD-carboxypeptidase [Rubrivivax gelatinosus]|uniref:Muramoyltetrapeptide carboxypeptidase n=1 Tax=Rubrivivax gelatinosus TaxID=28068 RepID=A0A4R2MHK4_RUBGE|nr:LD-carboxypeptidase [Rubrivivax gelatinosus]MBK1690346.1 LD-carboxypeptidase [Rubrivivax gelatinosus]TCP04094.1 muramoyltetrapeptide carboxypeptidase [Rubrivivax gelatinosus]
MTPHTDHDHDHGPGCDCDCDCGHEVPAAQTLSLYTPAGALPSAAPLRRAARRLAKLGYEVTIDESALARQQRFAGDDETRLAAIHRVAEAAPSIAMATRGGYGMTRLLDRLDWALLARSVEQGTRWVGHSDLTALQLGLLAHGGARSWAGPLAASDFGRSDADGGVDEVTEGCFVEAMSGELEAVGFRTEAGFDGLAAKGKLWGGNLTVLCSLLGTPHWPRIRGGVLFLEDVAEHPYRVERMLLQLLQAGVLGAQKAVLLGSFSDWKPVKSDRGYKLKTVVEHLRAQTGVPVLTGLPFGHVPTKVTLPVGAKVELAVQGRNVLVGW